MTDLTPLVNQLLTETHSAPSIKDHESRKRSTEMVDEFLKEAYRIQSHIYSLLHYLQSIRHSYLSTTPPRRNNSNNRRPSASLASDVFPPVTFREKTAITTSSPFQKHFTDEERDSIDTSTALLLRDLSSSIANLSSAETLRQETESRLLRKKYTHHGNSALWRWAAGEGASSLAQTADQSKTPEQRRDEECAHAIRTVRESVLWYLRRVLESAAEVQRRMVEKRIEREREKEKSMLYKLGAGMAPIDNALIPSVSPTERTAAAGERDGGRAPSFRAQDTTKMLSEGEIADIESQLSPEQLQLFAEENELILRHYEDTLSKVRNAEKSLLEISSLQETLVSHLATQEEYIEQLVTDTTTTHHNVGRGNKELQRATQRRSTAQTIFWGTVGLCTGLIVWDAIF